MSPKMQKLVTDHYFHKDIDHYIMKDIATVVNTGKEFGSFFHCETIPSFLKIFIINSTFTVTCRIEFIVNILKNQGYVKERKILKVQSPVQSRPKSSQYLQNVLFMVFG